MKRTVTTTLLIMAVVATFTSAHAQIIVNEVSAGNVDFMGTTNWVEFRNIGSADADAGTLFLCNFPAYPQIGAPAGARILEGDALIPPGGYLVVEFTALAAGDGEVGLYTSGPFDLSANILDYMQYGSAGHTREGTATGASIWTAGQFVALPATGQTMASDGLGSNAANWSSQAPTPGQPNPGVVANESDFPDSEGLTLLGAYPNPTSGATTVNYRLSVAGDVQIDVYDLLGRKQFSARDRTAAGDRNEFVIDASTLSSGLYIYRVTATQGGRVSTEAGTFTKSR